MGVLWLCTRQRRRWPIVLALLFLFLLWTLAVRTRNPEPGLRELTDVKQLPQRYRLTWKHVHSAKGSGGAWYIPPHWLSDGQRPPTNILDAARVAFQATSASADRCMANSSIPLIVHQTWKSTEIDKWPTAMRAGVEKWLEYASVDGNRSMAYFFWDDKGASQLMNHYEPSLIESYTALPMPVERADIFRIAVTRWIGGIYADADTEPLRAPATWITSSDLRPWTDRQKGISYGPAVRADKRVPGKPSNSSSPRSDVQLMVGIEADADPKGDAYWRMGYTYPIQLTQWALASAPHHPVSIRFLDRYNQRVSEIRDIHNGSFASDSASKALKLLDPIELTGPAAVTAATKEWLEEQAGLSWNSLSGLHDGGKSKVVLDVLVLPITGFSPGRGKYGNMGSKPLTHPDARLLHHAGGSWRQLDIKVEFGKFCRTVFGQCRYWSKVPG